MLTQQAVVLVGGKGTRLGALAADTPKPLMSIDQNSVFLDDVLFNISRHGFKDILLLAGHHHGRVTSRYAGTTIHGATVRVIAEPVAAGTAGALANAAPLLAETFLLANGDTLFDINLRCLDRVLEHSHTAMAVLALRRVSDVARYGRVELRDGRITAFLEKDSVQPGQDGLINAGIGLMRRDIISLVERTPCAIETDVYPHLAAAGRLTGMEFSGYFIDIGLPDTLAQARHEVPLRRSRPAVFFDRDGVLNRDHGYTHRVEDLDWIPGAIETIRRMNDCGALVFVVTNQAGVARGYFTSADVDRFHSTMAVELGRQGAHVDDFYICPYHPEATIKAFRQSDHPDRKPNPGMILRALKDWPVDRRRSVLIGDQQSDIEAANRAGLQSILFTGDDLRQVADAAFDKISAIGSMDHGDAERSVLYAPSTS